MTVDNIDRKEFEKAKDEYYTLRGWDVKTGAPTRETLKALGLSDICETLLREHGGKIFQA